MTHLGIDPGVKNIGVAITDDEGELVFSEVYSLGEDKLRGMLNVVSTIEHLCNKYEIETVAIERFVAFKGIHSKISEDILMLIGCLWYTLSAINKPKISLYRSIEWKPSLCKLLVKEQGFDNPSQKFDKQFSRAAAEKITKEKITNDHIADAIGLSYMWKI